MALTPKSAPVIGPDWTASTIAEFRSGRRQVELVDPLAADRDADRDLDRRTGKDHRGRDASRENGRRAKAPPLLCG